MSGIVIISWVVGRNYERRALLHREQVLRQNLDTLRHVIDTYTYDKRKAPQSLEGLIVAGYLRRIPVDPITKQADWKVVPYDTPPREPGIGGVHSASTQMSTEGTAYNTW